MEVISEILRRIPPLKSFILTIIFLIIGVFFAKITSNYFGLNDGIFYLTFLLLPSIFYLLFSGIVQHLKAPMGIEIKLSESAKSNISRSSIVNLIDFPIALDQDGVRELYQAYNRVNPFKPALLKITLPGNNLNYAVMKEHQRLLNLSTNFKFIVFIDNNEKFIAFIPSVSFFDLMLQDNAIGESFVNSLNSPDINLVNSFSCVSRRVVNTNSSNIEALHIISENNLDSSLVIDDGKIVGIITKERIISDIIEKLS
jgi:hypothetical protein